MSDPIRIANCSGFYGDRLSAAKEMVEGGPIDVLTGDWLAELTMLILARSQASRPGGGYARSFVTQMEQVMVTCLEKGIKVVSNAGGLDPAGCAAAVAEVADRLGLKPTIAYVDGDNLLPRLGELVASGVDLAHFETGEPIGDTSRFISANAYLGCWGIVDALDRGADIVITGRVTDAAVVCGPAAWHHRWARDDWDRLAGAVVAGHIIECGTQATGGNYSFFTEVPGMTRVGFPWAEVAADGSCVIGKHDGTGGEVSVGTVTSQLLYEIGSPAYLGPDVTARFDTIRLEQVARDRVVSQPARIVVIDQKRMRRRARSDAPKIGQHVRLPLRVADSSQPQEEQKREQEAREATFIGMTRRCGFSRSFHGFQITFPFLSQLVGRPQLRP